MELTYCPIEPRDGFEKKGFSDNKHQENMTDMCYDNDDEKIWSGPTPVANLVKKLSQQAPQQQIPNPCVHAKYHDIWINDPTELIDEPYLWPSKNMTLNQKLNSIVRGTFVATTAIYMLSSSKSRKIFYFLILAMIISVFLFYSKSFCAKIHPKDQIVSENKMMFIQKLLKDNNLDKKSALTDKDIKIILDSAKNHPEIPQLTARDIKEVIADATGVPTKPEQANDDVAQKKALSKKAMSDAFNIPEDYDWDRTNADPYVQKLFCGIDQAVEAETKGRNEILLTYNDMLDAEFENTLTSDFYGKDSQWWRDEGSFLVDRDIYHPKNTDLKFDEW